MAASGPGRGRAVATGAAAGVVAWVLGYAVTYLVARARVREVLSDLNAVVGFVGGNEVPAWKVVGWLYLNAHTVAARVIGVPGGTRTYDFLAASGGDASLLYVLPPLVLLAVVGVAVAAAGPRDAVSGAAAGAASALGYLLVTTVAAVVTSHGFVGGIRVEPAFVPALLLAGIAYPVVVGGAAGALVGVRSA
jgi:hypothetical protein